MKYVLALSVLTLLAACGDGNKDASDNTDGTTDPAATYTVDLSAQDMPLVMDLGDRASLGADSAHVHWNEEFGQLEVTAGEHFAVTITEAPGDLDRLKADLDRDMLQTHTVIEETPEMLIYRSQFPDADLVYLHFRKLVTVGDRTFVVEDAANGKFNEADVKRMAGSIKAKQAV